jgi:prevent-host-death family protein
MGITTVSSRDFNQNTSYAKKAAEDGPVFITDRGRTAHVLMTIREYQKLTQRQESLADVLALPIGADISDAVCEDFELLIPGSRELARGADFD